MGSIYSSSFDKNDENYRPSRKQGGRRKAKPTPPPALPEIDLPNPSLSEQERRRLRAKQLLASRAKNATIGDPGYIQELIQDGVSVPERHENQLGPTVVPEVAPRDMGSAPGQQHLRPLVDEDLQETENDHDLRLGSVQERFAALSAFDQVLQAFDQQLTQTFSATRILKQAAQQLKMRLQQERDDPELGQLADEIHNIVDRAVEPWLLEVEGYFNMVADKTVEGEQ